MEHLRTTGLALTTIYFGNTKTVLKASYAQYFDQRSVGQLAGTYNTTGVDNTTGMNQSYVEYGWNGALQSNGLPDMTGVNTSNVIGFGNQYNLANPGSLVSPNTVDPEQSRLPKPMKSPQVGSAKR